MRALSINAKVLIMDEPTSSKGRPGGKFTAGRRGDYTIDADGTVLPGKPTEFNKDNIDQFHF